MFPDGLSALLLRLPQLVVCLEVEPVLWRCSHPASKTQGRICGDASLSVDNLGHPVLGNSQCPGQRCLGHADLFKIDPEMLPRMNGWTRHMVEPF